MKEPRMIRATVWAEHVQDRDDKDVCAVYPNGMHETIAQGLREELGDRALVRTATLQDEDAGLGDEILSATDVLVWWGHLAHDQVPDERAARVQARVLEGMGLVVLHSGHLAKPFVRLMGTTCMLRFGPPARETVWALDPSHPVARGLPHAFVIEEHELYSEFFDIPRPDELVFVSSFAGGEVFRSGCAFYRGDGRVFYFSPGHETQPIYFQPEVRRVIANAVAWAFVESPPGVRTAHCVLSEPGWYR